MDESYHLFYERTEEEFEQIDFVENKKINVTFNVSW